MRFVSLFAGIGGLDLGLERAGMECVGQVEIDPYCRAVLAKHWPDVKRLEDVREVKGDEFGEFDLLCGGFPCQDISNAGGRVGIDGERSGLWSEFFRLIRTVRPRYSLVENVAAILGRGMDRVLGDLASIRFDAEWECIPACSVGAPHCRDRTFILAYPQGSQTGSTLTRNSSEGSSGTGANSASSPGGRSGVLGRKDWDPEPRICRVDDGVSANVDRVCVLGNAVVPQVAEVIGRAIMETEKQP